MMHLAARDTSRLDSSNLREGYWLTRFVFLRFLGLIYFLAFLSLVQQLQPLIGSDGLLPAHNYVEAMRGVYGDRLSGFLVAPTVFWLNCSDAFMHALAYLGVALSLAVLLGFANALLMAVLWSLNMSFVHVGQIFYGYGWEILVLETGFLAIFLCPALDVRPFPARVPPAKPIIWLVRWLLFRVMFGAGLIKLRGDACWRDLTCMMYHYETQPLPNPFSWYLHQLPLAFHKLEVLGNHFVELIAPWFLIAPRRLRHVAGILLVAFQLWLIVSGNLSWLNWLTITLCVASFDDHALQMFFPKRVLARVTALEGHRLTVPRQVATFGLTLFILYLSIAPVRNMLGSRQIMNGSFDRFDLVNTYGAFGGIGKRRPEVILEGTDEIVVTPATQWRAYEFKCKPGDVDRRPCFVAPYHYRIDWQIWFAAMQSYRSNPWLVHLVSKLLRNDPGALSLLAHNPFPERPPRFIRAELFEYEFTRFGDQTRAWWRRKRIGEYLAPLSLDSPGLSNYLRSHGWSE